MSLEHQPDCTYAVQLDYSKGPEWRIAQLVHAKSYHNLPGVDPEEWVWSDMKTTAYLGAIGDELRFVSLEARK